MKKLAILIAAGAMIGFAGSAMADPNENSLTTGMPGMGNQGCGFGEGAANAFKNPGKLFQSIRENFEGRNPKRFVEEVEIITEPDTVGEYIYDICKGTDPS